MTPDNSNTSLRIPGMSLTGESLCADCAAQSGTCCQTAPDNAEYCFPLSGAERSRLLPFATLASLSPQATAAFAAEDEKASLALNKLFSGDVTDTSLKSKDMPQDTLKVTAGKNDIQTEALVDAVSVWQDNSEAFIRSMHTIFPAEKKQVELIFPANGGHYRLRLRSDGACVFLGLSGCRLPRAVRPWYCRLYPAWIAGGSLTLLFSEDCLISQRAVNPYQGLVLLGMSAPDVRMLYQRLRQDWGI